jgi:hypothetical protein
MPGLCLPVIARTSLMSRVWQISLAPGGVV